MSEFESSPVFSGAIPERDIFTISRLVREAKAVLEGSFPLLWIEGEISNLARPSSGHFYFSLKDEAAQVRCAMFRMRNMHLGFTPENGRQILVRARVSLYEARGEFQLIVEHMEEAGHGALQRTFEQLKQKLSAEGLFDTAHKKPIPTLPRRIGVITSPTGAAIRDILSVLGRRFPAVPVLIYPVPVQGAGAGAEIAAAIRLASQRKDCDVLILSRGGGSLEDLWAFNEEVVARAIYACDIPLVSGVGHEIDFTIADFVADRRAPTPSAAAELVVPDQQAWLKSLLAQDMRLSQLLRRHLIEQRQSLTWLSKRLQQCHPGQQLRTQAQCLDELEQRLQKSLHLQLRHRASQLQTLNAKLQQHVPLNRLNQLRTLNDQLQTRLHSAWRGKLNSRKQQLAGLSRALESVSPLATLHRGYAIVEHLPDQAIIRRADDVKEGDKIRTRLSTGHLLCTIDKIGTDS
ncbi:MAG: exodeoxyribonuclease VII large subunit [Gammaproteobacteria bacterium]|nr:exodeoxyribonuclease VII large subunit [Gammaproteobacteria bacterium]